MVRIGEGIALREQDERVAARELFAEVWVRSAAIMGTRSTAAHSLTRWRTCKTTSTTNCCGI